jgi:hypothetical protein
MMTPRRAPPIIVAMIRFVQDGERAIAAAFLTGAGALVATMAIRTAFAWAGGAL